MYNKKSENTHIKTICSSGFASLTMSYFRTLLTLNFVPWLSRDNTGRDYYCKKVHLSTTVNHEGAKYFHQLAKSILDGSASDKQVVTILPCKNNTDLIFEYKPESDGQMMAYLSINKDKTAIWFRFPIHQYDEVDEKGQKVTKVIQSGLGAFAKVMEGYLINIGAGDTIDKLPDGFNEYQEYSRQVVPV